MITCGNFWMSVCGCMFSNQSMVHQNLRVPSPNAKPPPGNERLSGDYSGMMVNDLLDSHEWCSIHIPKVVYMDTFCLLCQMLGAGGDTRQVLPARQVMFSSIVGHLIVIGIVALSVHIIRSDIATKLASGNGPGDRWRRLKREQWKGGKTSKIAEVVKMIILAHCEQSVTYTVYKFNQIQICMFLGDCGIN